MSKQADRPEVVSADGLNELARRRGWSVRCDATCSFTVKELSDLHALWRAKAGSGDIPKRSEMTPRLLKPYMKFIDLHERIAGPGGTRRYRMRLMGDVATQIVGDTAGKFFEEFLPEKAVLIWNAMADAVLGHGAPLRMLFRADEIDKPHLVGEMFNAPLLTDDGSASLNLAAVRFDSNLHWEDLVAQLRRQDAQLLTVD
jgi:hypothetical protein